MDTVDGRRTIATTSDPALTGAMMSEEFVGRSLSVNANELKTS